MTSKGKPKPASTPAKKVNLSAVARAVSVQYKTITVQGLRKAIAHGRVPQNPTVEQAIHGLSRNTDPVNGGDQRSAAAKLPRQAPAPRAKVQNIEPQSPKIEPPDSKNEPSESGFNLDAPPNLKGIDQMDLVELRVERERVALQTEAIELLKAQQSVVDVEEARTETRKVLRTLRDQLMGMPQKIGPQLASMTDVRGITLMLEDYLRRCLVDAVNKLKAEANEPL